MTAEACTCTEDQVLGWVLGELDREEDVALAEHLGDCPECRDRAAEFAALGRALETCCGDPTIRWHAFETETAFGRVYVARTSRGLARISWQQADEAAWVRELEARFPDRPLARDPGALAEAERQLREYLSGRRTSFDLPVDLTSLGEFDRSVLRAASAIPCGEVVPYAELARRIGRPRAARAVGNALGRNPVAIVVPCHRVVRTDGSLGGYGGGVEWKERLLEMEGRGDLLAAS